MLKDAQKRRASKGRRQREESGSSEKGDVAVKRNGTCRRRKRALPGSWSEFEYDDILMVS